MRSLEGSGGEGSKARELVRSGEQGVFRGEEVGSMKALREKRLWYFQNLNWSM